MPLFCIDGNYYKWVHKSLQEYFAARFIHKDCEKSSDVLKRIFESDNLDYYINMLDIYADVDPFDFKCTIIKPLCLDFIRFYESNVGLYKGLSSEDVDKRISLLYMRQVYIIKVSYSSSPRDIIKYVDSICPIEGIRRSITIVRINDDYVGATVFKFDAKYGLMRFVALRFKDLRKSLHRQMNRKELTLFPEELSEITLDTGKESKEFFTAYNELLSYGHMTMMLDYEGVKKELDNIGSMQKAKGETLSLLESI